MRRATKNQEKRLVGLELRAAVGVPLKAARFSRTLRLTGYVSAHLSSWRTQRSCRDRRASGVSGGSATSPAAVRTPGPRPKRDARLAHRRRVKEAVWNLRLSVQRRRFSLPAGTSLLSGCSRRLKHKLAAVSALPVSYHVTPPSAP